MDAWLRRRTGNFARRHPYIAAVVAVWAMLELADVSVEKAVDFWLMLRREYARATAPLEQYVDNSQR